MNNRFKAYITSPLIIALGKRKEKAHFSKGPILIGGCARSGTTLLLAVLSAHPAVFAFPHETDAFTQWEKAGNSLRPVRPDRMYRSLLWHQVPKMATRWCEKRPANIRFIPEILEYLGPEARFIHLVRDPRAVCTSVHPRRPGEYWVPVTRYIEDVKAGLSFRGHPQVMTIKYEHLVEETEEVIRTICRFIGEEPHPHILDWYLHARVRKNRAWPHALRRMKTESLEKWKSLEHSDRVSKVLASMEICELMKQLEYEM